MRVMDPHSMVTLEWRAELSAPCRYDDRDPFFTRVFSRPTFTHDRLQAPRISKAFAGSCESELMRNDLCVAPAT